MTSVDRLDWDALEACLHQRGFAQTPPLLSPAECREIVQLYDEPGHWRSRVDMARHRFGSGEYQYFCYPLPPLVDRLRHAFYPHLATVANAWHAQLGMPRQFPADLESFLEECHAAGQTQPTPLVLRYGAGDYNCLHQDVYGELTFPLQVVILLSERGRDFTGGEFLLVENLPRAQSRGRAIALDQGQALIWPTRQRPAQGPRGHYRIAVRHGVSEILSGHRHTLGLIFHEAPGR